MHLLHSVLVHIEFGLVGNTNWSNKRIELDARLNLPNGHVVIGLILISLVLRMNMGPINASGKNCLVVGGVPQIRVTKT